MDQARDSRMRSTRRHDCEPPLPEPLAYFLTWPTYGTWLPGDERGWVEYRHGWQLPDPARKREAQARLTEDASLRTRWGEAGRRRFDLFRAGDVVPRIEQVYAGLLARRSQPADHRG